MNLNTKTRSSTLCANARTVLDLISLNFQRQPKKPPPTSSFREEDVAKLCCLCLLNGNRLSQHGNTSQYEFIWNPRSASLRIIYGSTLRRPSTLPCPPPPPLCS